MSRNNPAPMPSEAELRRQRDEVLHILANMLRKQKKKVPKPSAQG